MRVKQQMLWTAKKDGTRERIFCKACLIEGNPWLTPEPCEHILKADPGEPVQGHVMREILTELKIDREG
ncbi:hypothetical protein FBQ81_04075 [Chloroflexi bacterium CFX6]|nr:hypothetical protein [Chloroflexi bacterium CFX6]